MFRRFLVTFVFIFLVKSGAAQSLSERLMPLISAHEGDVAVAVKHLKTGESFTHKADEPMPTASLIKLPIMVEAYRQASEDKVDLAAIVMFKEAYVLAPSPDAASSSVASNLSRPAETNRKT